MDRMEKKLAKQLEKTLKPVAGKTKVVVDSKKVVKGFDKYGKDHRILVLRPKEQLFYLVRLVDNALSMPYTNDKDAKLPVAIRKVLYNFLVK